MRDMKVMEESVKRGNFSRKADLMGEPTRPPFIPALIVKGQLWSSSIPLFATDVSDPCDPDPNLPQTCSFPG